MVGHEDPCVDTPAVALACGIEPIEEQEMVGVGEEDFFSAITACHDVISRTGVDKSERSRHGC